MASNLKARTLGLLPLGAMPGVSQIPLSTIAALAIKAFRRATLDEAALLSNMHRCSADAGSGRLRPRSRSAFGLTKNPPGNVPGVLFAADANARGVVVRYRSRAWWPRKANLWQHPTGRV